MAKKKPDNRSLFEVPLAFLDVETTGLDHLEERVTEIACMVRDPDGTIRTSCSWLVNPGRVLSDEVIELTGITNEMLVDAPSFGQIYSGLTDIIPEDAIAVAYNAEFDRRFIGSEIVRLGRGTPRFIQEVVPWIDPMVMAKARDPYAKGKGRFKLGATAARLGVVVEEAHRALADVITLAGVFDGLKPYVLKMFGSESPTIYKYDLRQKILRAQQDANFLTWLSQQPALPEEE
jgi:DNA polymerase III epsilon subunit family exonuclease